jgi:hypothetical protein
MRGKIGLDGEINIDRSFDSTNKKLEK